MRDAICDTSPLLYLHRIHLLAFLPELAHRVIVPPAVVGEIETGGARGFDVPSFSDLSWVICSDAPAETAQSLSQDLGPGEIEVIRLAMENPEAIAVLDDKAARDEAARFGIQVVGTLRILTLFKQHQLIESVAPYVDAFCAIGFRVSDEVVEATLRVAGESSIST